jgi:hypothetical protein
VENPHFWRKQVLIVFLVDTSASMNQRTHAGLSYLDVAKHAVENFIKVRLCCPHEFTLLFFVVSIAVFFEPKHEAECDYFVTLHSPLSTN